VSGAQGSASQTVPEELHLFSFLPVRRGVPAVLGRFTALGRTRTLPVPHGHGDGCTLGGLKQRGFTLSPPWRPQAPHAGVTGLHSRCPSHLHLCHVVSPLIRMLVIVLGPILLQDELISASAITPAKAPFPSKAWIPGSGVGHGGALSEVPPSRCSAAGLSLSALSEGLSLSALAGGGRAAWGSCQARAVCVFLGAGGLGGLAGGRQKVCDKHRVTCTLRTCSGHHCCRQDMGTPFAPSFCPVSAPAVP